MKVILISSPIDSLAIVDDCDYEKLCSYHWYLTPNGYIMRCAWIDGKTKYIQMHREVLPHRPGYDIDHINHLRFDNRRTNLRYATRSQNLRNAQKTTRTTSSRFKGVHYCKQTGRWSASISLNDSQIWLGRHKTEEEAALAYNKKALELSREFAVLNEVAA